MSSVVVVATVSSGDVIGITLGGACSSASWTAIAVAAGNVVVMTSDSEDTSSCDVSVGVAIAEIKVIGIAVDDASWIPVTVVTVVVDWSPLRLQQVKLSVQLLLNGHGRIR